MDDVGVGISHEYFLLQPGQASENEQGMSVQGSPKSSHCRKQAPLKPFLSVCIPTTLRRKPVLFFPVLCKENTLTQPYPVLGGSVCVKDQSWDPASCRLCKDLLLASFVPRKKTFRTQDDGGSVQYIPYKTLRGLKNSCILK